MFLLWKCVLFDKININIFTWFSDWCACVYFVSKYDNSIQFYFFYSRRNQTMNHIDSGWKLLKRKFLSIKNNCSKKINTKAVCLSIEENLKLRWQHIMGWRSHCFHIWYNTRRKVRLVFFVFFWRIAHYIYALQKQIICKKKICDFFLRNLFL